MSGFSRWSSRSAALLALGITTGAVAPWLASGPAFAQANLSDVRNHWARPFIEALAADNVIAGFPDGTFRPDQPVTRAQFAAIVRQAFNESAIRQTRGFSDVPSNYWATEAIGEAYTTGFMAGYPNSQFLPNQEIPKVQVLVSLSSGLRYTPTQAASTGLKVYSDAGQIPDYAVNGVAAATEKSIVVNYPNLQFLNPNETATRADVAAYIYQALVNKGEFQPLATREAAAQYIVRGTAGSATQNQDTGSTTNPTQTKLKILQGTKVKVKYPVAGVDQIILAPGQTVSTTLEVAEDVKNLNQEVVIPVGTQIEGRLVPVKVVGSTTQGTQFVADRLIYRGQAYTDLNLTSDPIIATNRVSTETVEDARATPAAQAILGRILGGGANLSSVLAGVLTGQSTTPPASSNQNSVIVIEPSTDLLLTFRADLNI